MTRLSQKGLLNEGIGSMLKKAAQAVGGAVGGVGGALKAASDAGTSATWGGTAKGGTEGAKKGWKGVKKALTGRGKELEDYIVERTLAVVGTNTTTKDIVVKGNLFSHLLIVFYYYGWGHYLLEYIFNKYNITHIDIVEEMFEYFENKKDSIIGKGKKL